MPAASHYWNPVAKFARRAGSDCSMRGETALPCGPGGKKILAVRAGRAAHHPFAGYRLYGNDRKACLPLTKRNPARGRGGPAGAAPQGSQAGHPL